MEEKDILIIGFQKVFDKVAWKILYRDEEIFKRYIFRDEELKVESWGDPRFEDGILYLSGDKKFDDYINICSVQKAEIIKDRVKKLNDKYKNKKISDLKFE